MNNKKNVLATLRDQKMDRKSFLKMSGFVVLGTVGAKTIVTMLKNEGVKSAASKSTKAHGFGTGKYGV